MNIIVTGGAGFIGSALVRRLIADTDHEVLTIDKLTYAGNLQALAPIADHPRHRFGKFDIGDAGEIRTLWHHFKPELVMHLAAESHVDRSIDTPTEFVHTNVLGTDTLLETSMEYWRGLSKQAKEGFRFHHVSTDEVYGSLGLSDKGFVENTRYDPNSPYSATKAASDHLVRAWHHTYGLPVVLSNCTNNYGPYQYPEKLIPLVIGRAIAGEKLPIYGRGENIRTWIHVEDHVEALMLIAQNGRIGQHCDVRASAERTNLSVVAAICDVLDVLRLNDPIVPHRELIEVVADRAAHDLRYAMSADRLREELGWAPSRTIEEGIAETINRCLGNLTWYDEVTRGNYDGRRLGERR